MFVQRVWVMVSADEYVAFESEPPDRPDPRQVELGESAARNPRMWMDELADGGRVLAVYETNPMGRVLVTGLAVGVTATIHVKDATGQVIAPEQTVESIGQANKSWCSSWIGSPHPAR